MYEQVKDLKEGKTVQKRIYNHVTGVMDAPEEIVSPNILILEGHHPFADKRVREMFDFKIYLDISDDVKFAWKIQRDMAERGHSLESIKASSSRRAASRGARRTKPRTLATRSRRTYRYGASESPNDFAPNDIAIRRPPLASLRMFP